MIFIHDFKDEIKAVEKYNSMFGRDIDQNSAKLQLKIHKSELKEYERAKTENDLLDAVADCFVTIVGLEWMIRQFDSYTFPEINAERRNEYEKILLRHIVNEGLEDKFKKYLNAVTQSNLTKFSKDLDVIKNSRHKYGFKTKTVSVVCGDEIYHHLISDEDVPHYPKGKQLKPGCYKHPEEFYNAE